MTLLIKNALSIRNGNLRKCSLLIKKDKIASFSFYDVKEKPEYLVLDAEGLLLLPGIIDPHVHFRQPGFTHKETLFTGSCAAAAGGVTTVFDMPNTSPPTITVNALNQKRELANTMVVNYGFYFGGVASAIKQIPKAKNVPGTKVYMDITTGKHIVSDIKDLQAIFKVSKRVAVHAEQMNVKVAIDLAKKAKKLLYCCHISTAKELALIAEAKNNGQKVKCEVTPHHLFLSHDDDKSAFTKMKPPLREKKNQAALWNGIESGIIDTVGTDHAPHTEEEKNSLTPPFGIPGIETSLPLMLTAVAEGKTTYERVRELMCHNPAKIFKVKGRGKIKKGNYADLVLVDITNYKKVDAKKFHSKCKWSPFDGRELTGWPKYTFVNGNLIYDNGRINNIPAHEAKFL